MTLKQKPICKKFYLLYDKVSKLYIKYDDMFEKEFYFLRISKHADECINTKLPGKISLEIYFYGNKDIRRSFLDLVALCKTYDKNLSYLNKVVCLCRNAKFELITIDLEKNTITRKDLI